MILFLLLLNFAHAENWMRVDDIKAGLVRGFEMKKDCENEVKIVPCQDNPEAKCQEKMVCVEIGNLSPDVVMVDEKGDAVVDPAKKAAKDAKVSQEQAANAKRAAAVNALKSLPPVIPANQMSDVIHKLLEAQGIK